MSEDIIIENLAQIKKVYLEKKHEEKTNRNYFYSVGEIIRRLGLETRLSGLSTPTKEREVVRSVEHDSEPKQKTPKTDTEIERKNNEAPNDSHVEAEDSLCLEEMVYKLKDAYYIDEDRECQAEIDRYLRKAFPKSEHETKRQMANSQLSNLSDSFDQFEINQRNANFLFDTKTNYDELNSKGLPQNEEPFWEEEPSRNCLNSKNFWDSGQDPEFTKSFEFKVFDYFLNHFCCLTNDQWSWPALPMKNNSKSLVEHLQRAVNKDRYKLTLSDQQLSQLSREGNKSRVPCEGSEPGESQLQSTPPEPIAPFDGGAKYNQPLLLSSGHKKMLEMMDQEDFSIESEVHPAFLPNINTQEKKFKLESENQFDPLKHNPVTGNAIKPAMPKKTKKPKKGFKAEIDESENNPSIFGNKQKKAKAGKSQKKDGQRKEDIQIDGVSEIQNGSSESLNQEQEEFIENFFPGGEQEPILQKSRSEYSSSVVRLPVAAHEIEPISTHQLAKSSEKPKPEEPSTANIALEMEAAKAEEEEEKGKKKKGKGKKNGPGGKRAGGKETALEEIFQGESDRDLLVTELFAGCRSGGHALETILELLMNGTVCDECYVDHGSQATRMVFISDINSKVNK